MNDKFTNNMNREDEIIGQKLDRVANQTNISSQFASELEERLRIAHQPKMSWFASSFKQVSPTLRWVGLVLLLGLVLNWSIKSLIPAPQPATDNTFTPEVTVDEGATPIPDSGGYDWRGTKLYLATVVPKLPTDAKVYSLKDEQPATVDIARVLATQFGIQGNVYETPGRLAGIPGYLVTDGKQRLYIHSALNYDYYSEYSIFSFLSGGKNISNEQASAAIDAFMKAHGMDFEYQIENAHQLPGAFYVVPLTPDGLPVRYDYNMPSRFEFTVNNDGQIVLMSSYRVDYGLVDTYGIRTAEEAFQQVLGSSNVMQNGVLEITYSGGILNEYFWQRAYPDNQTVTIYGQPIAYPAAETDASPFVSIGQYTATGNISGIENIDSSNYVEAIGQFTTENGIRIFNVETWRILDSQETSISGILHREGDQVILMANDGSGEEYIIEGAPTDVPLNTPPDEQLNVNGFLMNGNFNWTSIQYFPANSGGGGGGGGGTGFYQLNLSGTPVPFLGEMPTPLPNPTSPPANPGNVQYVVQEGDTLLSIAQAFWTTPERIFQVNGFSSGDILMPGMTIIIPDIPGVLADLSPLGKRIERLRGLLSITIYKKPDGSQRTEYILVYIPVDKQYSYMSFQTLLEGIDLQALQAYQNRPIEIWGTISGYNKQNLLPIVNVERFNIPFPDLNFQILKGRQRTATIDGQDVILFTTEEDQTYVQSDGLGDVYCCSLVGNEGDNVWMEALIVPGDTFGAYPLLRVFNAYGSQPTEFTITSDQPYVMDEAPSPENYIPPTATIEKVELVYYTPDPRSTPPDPNAGPQYIQPAWRFYGHYSNGDEFEILVQALKQEYLLPELAPYTPPG